MDKIQGTTAAPKRIAAASLDGFRRERRARADAWILRRERAYGACVYVRRESAIGQPRIELLISKSRVAPVRAISIPRLELNAVIVG